MDAPWMRRRIANALVARGAIGVWRDSRLCGVLQSDASEMGANSDYARFARLSVAEEIAAA